MHKLALNGGDKAVAPDLRRFDHPLFVRSYDLTRLARTDPLDYGGGGTIDVLEAAWREWCGMEFCLSFNSGTSALYALYHSNKLTDGAEVIVPGYGFFATATPLVLLKARIILADCDRNGNIDPEDVAKKCSSRTRAIVATHMWGIPCEMDALRIIARKHDALLLEDASHAHGARYKGRMVGSLSDGAAWSVGARKNISGGQGGMLATGDARIFQESVLIGHYNRNRGSLITLPDLVPYAISGIGLNLRMHPYAAQMIIDQLPCYSQQFQERMEVASFIAEKLKGLPGLQLPAIDPETEPAWYAFPFTLDLESFHANGGKVSRETILSALHAEGAVEFDIPSSTAPQSKYKIFTEQTDTRDSIPAAERYASTVMKMPVWYGPRRFDYAEQYTAALAKVVGYFSYPPAL